MSRSADILRRRGFRTDGGFTLIEVIVAIGIMVLVTAALTPQIVVGLRSAGTARDITQAKGVAQARLEQIRNMPYYVGRAAGDYIDVLDTYYRNTTVPGTAPTGCSGTTLSSLPSTGWTGYVPADGARCVWEPAGAFYRKVVNPIEAPGLGTFAMVISTQFLSSSTPPTNLPPLAGYDSQVAGKDAPASSQLGITVSVFFATQAGVRYTTTQTQVERANPIAPLLDLQAKGTTVAVSSATSDGTLLLQQVGIVNLVGELFTGSRVVATAAAGAATTSLGEQASGALLNLVAPTDKTTQHAEKLEVKLGDGCTRMCFGKTRVDQATALASNGLPRAGSAAAPIRAFIQGASNQDGFRFSNGAAGTRLALHASEPMVSVDTSTTGTLPTIADCAATASTFSAHLAANGHLTATTDTAESCATAQSLTIRLFPTTFQEGGLVRIRLSLAAASCRVDRASGSRTATASYLGTVSYWNGATYVDVEVGSHLAVSPLTDDLLTTGVGHGGLTLGDYVSSWKALVSSDLVTSTGSRSAEARVPGAITIITQPTREGVSGGTGAHSADPTSAISLSVGSVACKASDQR